MKTLPYAKPIGVYEAKTHFSKIVDDLVNGRCGPVPVLRHGKKAVFIVTDEALSPQPPAPKSIIGCMEGKFRHLEREDVKLTPEEVERLFGETRFAAKDTRLA